MGGEKGDILVQAENLRTPALIVTVLAWGVLALSALAALARLAWLIGYTQDEMMPGLLLTTQLLGIFSNLVFLLSVVAVLVWTFMAHDNLHRAGLSGLNYSPAWASLSFLVPIANLFVPMRAMRELANRSAGEPEEFAEAEVSEVQSWWAPWLGSIFFGLFVTYTQVVALIPRVFVTTPFWATEALIVLTNIFVATSAFFLIKVVEVVTNDQLGGLNTASTFE
jgi:Domain of unknown function (DUF4328)